MDICIIYLFITNAAAFLLMLADKRRAVKGTWRIPESTLMGIAAIGGSLGAVIAMRLFHHKTRHPKFYIGLPVLLAVHILLLVWLLIKTA